MRRCFGLILLLLLLLCGCQNPGMPADPLFGNGKPAESKARIGPPAAPRFSEPTSPALISPAARS